MKVFQLDNFSNLVGGGRHFTRYQGNARNRTCARFRRQKNAAGGHGTNIDQQDRREAPLSGLSIFVVYGCCAPRCNPASEEGEGT